MNNYTTSQRRTAKLILDRWKAELSAMDKTFNNVASNFDDLVSNMHLAEVPFELAEENMQAAILEHYPSSSIAKKVWSSTKARGGTDKDCGEFFSDWKKAISNEGKRVFYSYYKLSSDEVVKNNKKSTGSMSNKEHRAQQRYAESFPVLDTSQIDVKIKDTLDAMEKDFMKAVLGEDNDE
jgi:hypothetical protein